MDPEKNELESVQDIALCVLTLIVYCSQEFKG